MNMIIQKTEYDQVVALLKLGLLSPAVGASEVSQDSKIQIEEAGVVLHLLSPDTFVTALLRDSKINFTPSEDQSKKWVETAQIKKGKN